MRDWQSIDFAEAFSRLHPVLLHLPIGLFLALAWVHLWSRFGKSKPKASTALVWLLLLTTPTAAASGWFLHEGASYPEEVEWHEWGGITLAFLSLFVAIAHWRGSRWYGPLIWLSCLVLLPTAHLGGSLTHGDEFLLGPWLEDGEQADEDAKPKLEPNWEGASSLQDTSGAQAGTADSQSSVDSELAEATSAVEGPADLLGPGGYSSIPEATFAGPGFADVQPILVEFCGRCHSERKQRGGLSMESLETMLVGGDSGAALTPGDSTSSLMMQRIFLPLEHEDHMPPDNKAQPSQADIDQLVEWLNGMSAPKIAPGSETEVQDPGTESAPDSKAETETSQVEAQNETTTAPDADAITSERASANRAEQNAALLVLRDRLAHVQPIEAGSDELWVDFTSVELQPDELTELLGPLRERVVDLSLSGKSLSSEDQGFLGELLSLRRLDLRRLSQEQVDLSALRAHPSLRVLNMAGTVAKAGAGETLDSIPTLERVYVWGTGLDEDADWLASARDGLTIIGASRLPDEALEVEPEVEFEKLAKSADDSPAVKPATDEVAKAENTLCPVSGGAVDSDYVILYQGRAIGFCCSNCPKSFWDDPASYLAKLGD